MKLILINVDDQVWRDLTAITKPHKDVALFRR